MNSPTNKTLFPELLIAEQYRMNLLQVFNWGTFSELHRIPIAKDGFLFVGRSGSGKSTLLDALSVLLVPPQWLGFNAAAREGDKNRHDRNLALYVRGAWGDQTDNNSGEIATQFLRKGTTWSAVALQYQNLAGKTVTLIGLFILRGTSNSATEVQRHFMIAERPFDLAVELLDFDLDIRRLKQKFSDIFHTDKFKAYSERFRALLNIDSEMALKLLHKTQSAKNLGDLNLFLREYMLDAPETFTVAERLVSEFVELDAAHQTVVTAREQVHLLSEARENYQQLQMQQVALQALRTLRDEGVDSYSMQCQKQLLQEAIQQLKIEELSLSTENQQQQEYLMELNAQLRRLQTQRHTEGGERIGYLQTELARAEQNKQQCLHKREHVSEACKKLNLPLPETLQNYMQFISTARHFNESWQTQKNQIKNELYTLRDQRHAIANEFAQARAEVNSLRRQPSNIPVAMLELRQQLVTALGLQEADLPFAGELIEVQPNALPWRGAIERLLHGFALSLLVDEQHYAMLSNYINATSLHKRLVYYRVNQAVESYTTTLLNQSLIHKLQLKKGHYSNWLAAELKRRFNYICVENMQEFRKSERALTREGQIRHGKTQHEKDDRRAIDDKKYWVLGFDNQEKLQLFEARVQALADQLSTLDNRFRQLEESENAQTEKAMTYQNIINITWQEIDVTTVLDQLAQLQQELQQLHQGNTVLQKLAEQIKVQENNIIEKESNLRKNEALLLRTQQNLKDYNAKLSGLNERSMLPLSVGQMQALQQRFDKEVGLTLDNIDSIAKKVERALTAECETLAQQCTAQQHTIERIFQQFKNRWPQDGADLDASLAAAPEFLDKLIRIERDGLPAHEERFFNMLRDQSMQNLTALNTHLSQARKDILSRMELVNESLAGAEYNPGTHLEIEVSDRQLESVKNFREQIREILSHAWGEDRELAEQRFNILRALVEKLSSQDYEQQRWRQQVLDVRLHVEFIAREYNAQRQEVEVYRSGAGKSGGQREKLATTCLAAALCYQLGGQQRGVPLYAPVVLDEAFSKADNEFTQEVMKVFTNFGFQMIVATPFKSVMTLEPFIAGACFVDISERKYSSTLQINYQFDKKRLDLPEGLST